MYNGQIIMPDPVKKQQRKEKEDTHSNDYG
jgi:hypothetical protein